MELMAEVDGKMPTKYANSDNPVGEMDQVGTEGLGKAMLKGEGS